MKITVGILLLFAPLAHADIVGGEDVKPDDSIRDSIAALYAPGSSSLCTASVIGSHTALTAAHCVSKSGPKPVLIFGNNVRDHRRVMRKVSTVAVHPKWGGRSGLEMDQGDIAIVKFREKLPKSYHPVPLLGSDSALKKGKLVTLAGYGISDAQRKTGAGVLRKTRVKVEDPRAGKSEMVLDQSAGHGACHGDSGGPAYLRRRGKFVLAGVTNRSYPNGAPDDCKHKVVYTKVNAYEPWIRSTEQKLERTRASTFMRAAKSRIGRSLPMGASTLARLKTSSKAALRAQGTSSRPSLKTPRVRKMRARGSHVRAKHRPPRKPL